MTFINNIIRDFLFFFDKIIYGLISPVYELINILAAQTIFKDEAIQRLADNIYAILGVYVLFRVAFVLLNAIIDPDKLMDNEKGAAKIASRLIIAMILIAAIPWGFKYAFDLQSVILRNQIMTKIIVGKVEGNVGTKMGALALKSFLSCREGALACASDPTQLDRDLAKAFPSDKNAQADFSDLEENLNKKTELNGKKVYIYEYNGGISTVCGGFILFVFISLAVDIAIRAVKLGLLRLMAPIAVMGYVEPGGGIFNRWLKMCFSTFTNLFIKLLSISFMIYGMSLIDSDNFAYFGPDGEPLHWATRQIVKLFLLLGLILFAKEAPKMISQIFGIEEGGIGSLFKNPLTGGILKGTAALAGGAAGFISSGVKGGNVWAGAKQGAGAGAKGVSWTGGLKGMGGVATSWHKGATAGASGALGVDTKVGFSRLWEKAVQKTEDQQTRSREKTASKDLAETYKHALELRSQGADESELFKNKEFKNKYRDFSAAKAAVKSAQAEFDMQQQIYNHQLNDGKSQLYWASSGLREAKANKAASAGTADEAVYDKLIQTYEKDLEEASKFYADAKSNLKSANDKFEVNQKAFETEQKLHKNAEDLAELERLNELKNSGRL